MAPARAWLVALAACGGRVGPLPPADAQIGGSDNGDGIPAECTEFCASLRQSCATLSFNSDECGQTCERESWFDDCATDCYGDCGCMEQCHAGKTLTCGGFCAYLQEVECDPLDVPACRSRCAVDGAAFEACTKGCGERDCACLQGCAASGG